MLGNVKTPPPAFTLSKPCFTSFEEPDWARFIETCLAPSLPSSWMGWAGITVSCRFLLLSVRSNQSDAERTKPAGSYDNARIHAAFSIWKKTRCLIAHPSPCIRREGRVGGELWHVIRKQPRPIRHWCIRRWGRTRGARLVGSRGWKMTAPPLRSTSLGARTFAFTPGSNERKILRRGWKREGGDHSRTKSTR